MILRGKIVHRRHFPVRYRFVYGVFSLLLDIDELPASHRRLRLFSHNRPNLFSFYDRDYGPGREAPLRPWLEGLLALHRIELEGGRVELLAFPRMLGFVFNPLSLWYCYHRDGVLRAVVCEVRNTFGERHHYLIHRGGAPMPWPVRDEKPKVFHVSPFIGMDARYRFRLDAPGQRRSLGIRETRGGELMLEASLAGTLTPLSDAGLLRAFLAFPFMTVKVVAMIHWQALKLWLRRVPVQPKPATSGHGVS